MVDRRYSHEKNLDTKAWFNNVYVGLPPSAECRHCGEIQPRLRPLISKLYLCYKYYQGVILLDEHSLFGTVNLRLSTKFVVL